MAEEEEEIEENEEGQQECYIIWCSKRADEKSQDSDFSGNYVKEAKAKK
jgi:hypothetical protein